MPVSFAVPPRSGRPDPFEQTLRAVLADRAAPLSTPASLSATLDDVIAGRIPTGHRRQVGPSRPRGWLLRSVAAGVALLAIAALVGGLLMAPGVGPMGGSLAGAGGDDDAGSAIDWDSGRAHLQADSFRVEAIGTFRGQPDTVDGAPAMRVKGDPGSPTYRTLEVEWQEQGVPMRLYIYFAADETHWWVTEMRTYDGSTRGEWVYYHGDRFRTPRGESFVGRFEAAGTDGRVPGSLRIEGLRLTAFAPGTGPAPLQGCRMYDPDGIDARFDLEPLVGMTGAQAGDRVRARGLCLEYRWSYRLDRDTRYTERWCVAPPRGRVSDADASDDGVVMLWVDDDSGHFHERRDQPVAGWGCPVDEGPIVPAPSVSPGASIPMSSALPAASVEPMRSDTPDDASIVPVASPR